MQKKLLLLFLFIPILAFSQSKEAKITLEKYQSDGVYKVDGANIVVTVVLEDVKGSKEDLYLKVKNYFARAYKDANSVLQVDDKDGGILVGKGLYSEFFGYTANMIIPVRYSTYHVMRVDIKDNRLRVICSADEWIAEWSTPGNNYKKELYPIVDCIPLGKKKIYSNANKTADAFLALVDKMHASVDALEKSLTGGSIAGENDDW